MLGVVPYYPPFSITLFDIPLDSWSLLVALGFVVGIEFARARAQQLGIRVWQMLSTEGCSSSGWDLWWVTLFMWGYTIRT